MTATLHEAFGENLARARERAGVTQSELARRAGISASEVCRLEAGLREPLLMTIVMLARALETEPVELLGGLR